jgi:redox-sensitive bicupin YhaK (pirin superfamily)
MASRIRSVARVVPSTETMEGEGFLVHRPFPTRELVDFDPFLLLDRMGPFDAQPGEAKGAPDHPHRGFETVTYMLDGEFEHEDSMGNKGKLASGDVQWMTAGAGVVHSELPSARIRKEGGRIHGFQLWVNLPKRDKMMRPRYQDVPSSKIPVAQNGDGSVRAKVIAGEAFGVHAVIDTRTPIEYLHFQLEPGAKVTQAIPSGHNAFAFVISGTGRFGQGGHEARENDAVFFATGTGDEVSMEASGDAPLSVLLIAGQPLREPVARYGPFVMNTREEILQAFDDFRSGKMGRIEPEFRHG